MKKYIFNYDKDHHVSNKYNHNMLLKHDGEECIIINDPYDGCSLLVKFNDGIECTVLDYELTEINDVENIQTHLTTFIDSKVIINQRKNGVQPAIFIISNGNIHMIGITPEGDFDISDEGAIGERYDENGNWVG